MIRHTVYFWLDPTLSDEDRHAFEGGLQALFDIDVVVTGHYGRAAGTPERPVTNNDYDFALFLEFETIEDHNSYQVHPDHDVFVKRFSPWFATVKVFDTDIS